MKAAAALDTAYMAARLFDGHLHCICVRPGPGQIIVGALPFEMGVAMNTADLVAALRKENELRTKNARVAFDRVCKKWEIRQLDDFAGKGVSATWQQITGDGVVTTISEAPYYDLIGLGRPAEPAALSTNGIGVVLVGSGRPLLVAPNVPSANLCSHSGDGSPFSSIAMER